MLELFVTEAQELLESLENALLALESAPHDTEQVASAFRALHTLKGSGAMVGHHDLAAFAHEFEGVFDRLRSGELQITTPLISLALAAKDHLATYIEDTPDPVVRDRLLSGLKTIVGDADGAPSSEPAPHEPHEPQMRTLALELRFAADLFYDGTNVLALFDELREHGTLALHADSDRMPSLDTLDPELLYIRWFGTLTTDADIEAVRETFIFLADDAGIEIREVEDVPATSEPDTLPVPTTLKARAGGASATTPVIKVQVDRLDRLVDLVGELVISKSRLVDVASRSHDGELLSIAEVLERLVDELRSQTMGLRMVPMSSTFQRFERLVRDLSVDLDKELELVTEGGDTELDKTVIDQLADPLIHLIRNAADHAIESFDVRRDRGKPTAGRITLCARQVESRVIIEVRDDGGGLDADAIRRKGVEKGLVDADAQLSLQDTYGLILQPGFSTASKVSNISGRGVGMDAVNRTIKELSGTLTIDSSPGVGTCMQICLPVSLAITDGLLVRVDGDPFVFPLSVVEECVEPPEHWGHDSSTGLTDVRGEVVPVLRLRKWFEIDGVAGDDAQVVITRLSGGRFGFVVDSVVGQHQTVVKDLGPFGRDTAGVSGATILGDGAVALILDPEQIVESARATL